MGGKIQILESVVATIAGISAREVEGIHRLGRSRLLRFGRKPSRGVTAEVGDIEAALDLEVVIEHGRDIRQIAGELRDRVASDVATMTGRLVVEVNIDVIGIALPGAAT